MKSAQRNVAFGNRRPRALDLPRRDVDARDREPLREALRLGRTAAAAELEDARAVGEPGDELVLPLASRVADAPIAPLGEVSPITSYRPRRAVSGRRSRGEITVAVLKVLLVTLHFPPGGGGGVHRPLKFATHLPALGIETHVLAPDVPGRVCRRT